MNQVGKIQFTQLGKSGLSLTPLLGLHSTLGLNNCGHNLKHSSAVG